MRSNASVLLVLAMVIGPSILAFAAIKPAFHIAAASCAAVAMFMHCTKPELGRVMISRLLVAAVGMPVLAWSLTSVWQLYAIMLIWVPLVARRPTYVVPVYLYSLLLLPGLDDTIAAGPVKLFDFGVHDALGLGAAFALFRSGSKARPGLPLDLPAIAVMLLLGAALARETTITHFFRMSINVALDLGLPYYILSRGLRSMSEFRAAMLGLACGAVTLAAILLYEAWKSWPIYNELYGHYSLPTLLLVKARGGVLRSGGPFVEPTSAAMVLATCILALWLSRDSFRARHWYLVACGFALAGLSAPQSRGAWIGLLLAMAVALLFRRQYGKLLAATGAVGSTGIALFLAARVSPYLSETLGLSGGSSETSEYRRKLFNRGLEEFWNSPLIGFSMPEVNARLADLRQGEGIVDFVNTYIWILLISGASGTLIFVGAFAAYLGRTWRLRRSFGQLPGGIAAASFVFAGLVMPLEMLFFTSFGGRPAFFVFALFGFAASLIHLHSRHRQDSRRSDHRDPAAAGLGTFVPQPVAQARSR